MKEKVKFSALSLIITAAILILAIVGIVSLLGETSKLIMFCVIMALVVASGLYFCPTSVEVGPEDIILHRLASAPKRFAYSDIRSVATCYPSAGGLRLCGSGGFFGYWGYFSDIMIGTYFGYYGSRSHCILLKLKNGRQYILGCTSPASLLACLSSRIN